MSGGGGDLVASEVRVNQLPKKIFNTVANPLRPTSKPRRAWRRRLSKEGRSPCQPGFFKPFHGEDQGLQNAENRQEKPEACPYFVTERFDWSAETMSTTLQKQEVFRTPRFQWNQKTCVSKAPAADPSPGEAAIYGAPTEVASAILAFPRDRLCAGLWTGAARQ